MTARLVHVTVRLIKVHKTDKYIKIWCTYFYKLSPVFVKNSIPALGCVITNWESCLPVTFAGRLLCAGIEHMVASASYWIQTTERMEAEGGIIFLFICVFVSAVLLRSLKERTVHACSQDIDSSSFSSLSSSPSSLCRHHHRSIVLVKICVQFKLCLNIDFSGTKVWMVAGFPLMESVWREIAEPLAAIL